MEKRLFSRYSATYFSVCSRWLRDTAIKALPTISAMLAIHIYGFVKNINTIKIARESSRNPLFRVTQARVYGVNNSAIMIDVLPCSEIYSATGRDHTVNMN